ncbi:MAG: pyruvate dehydrogenase (acetyl-transferring) E1 component subunit alpha, partial [Cyclobacteriaceae bacterium]|nr:pyruvate dehydrogenase (acetyl-transferring) E1 component subunit alpha [Cyclobacteriaceae bacterium]
RTYRYKGHSMSDPAKYRTKEEVAAYKRRDPIEQVKLSMLKYKIADEAYFQDIESKTKKIVLDSVEFAEESKLPDPNEIYKDVYMQEDYPFVKD